MSLRVSRPGRVSIDGPTPPTPQPPLARRSPAHDFVGQQHAAHLGVLVLAFVHDGLAEYKQKREGITGRCGAGARAAGAPGGVQRPGTVVGVAATPAASAGTLALGPLSTPNGSDAPESHPDAGPESRRPRCPRPDLRAPPGRPAQRPPQDPRPTTERPAAALGRARSQPWRAPGRRAWGVPGRPGLCGHVLAAGGYLERKR